jgi:hypothetical protein
MAKQADLFSFSKYRIWTETALKNHTDLKLKRILSQTERASKRLAIPGWQHDTPANRKKCSLKFSN